MKKIVYVMLFIIICIASFASLGCNNTNSYSLTVDDENGLLYEPLSKFYNGGETVTFKTPILNDSTIVATINGEDIKYTPVSKNGKYTNWEFTFIMPNYNSTLVLKVENGFLPPALELDSTIAYYDFTSYYNADFLMNAYIPTLSTWENIKPLLPSFESDYDEQYFEENALLVMFGRRGTCENRKIESTVVTLSDYTITVTIYAEPLDGNVALPPAMAEWVVVLEIKNNIAFSNIVVNAVF